MGLRIDSCIRPLTKLPTLLSPPSPSSVCSSYAIDGSPDDEKALAEKCPSGFFVFLETVINVSLIVEVAVRIIAQRGAYFRYLANIIDVVIVLFCIVTLILLRQDCSSGNGLEEAVDTVLLVVRYVCHQATGLMRRNTVQCFRLYMMMKRYAFDI
jgi:hypothetical protein